MNYKIKHLLLFFEGKHDLIPKSLAVELVNLGILNYKKLTSENYNYWWYQVELGLKIDKKAFTFNWSDFATTKKTELVKKFIHYHKEDESIYNLITAVLNIESARFDGFDVNTGVLEFERQIEFYYGKRIKKGLQLALDFN